MKNQILTYAFVTLMLFFISCGDNSTDPTSEYGPVHVTMSLNGNPELNAMAQSPLDQSAPVLARVSTMDIEINGQVMPKNTLNIGGTVFIGQDPGKSKTLSIVMMNIEAPGTYKLLEQDGLFVYSDASEGIDNLVGLTIFETGDGTLSLTIEEIGDEPIPTLGRLVKGTFTATITDGGTTYNITGSFNGGIPE